MNDSSIEQLKEHLEKIRAELDRTEGWLAEGRVYTAVAKAEQFIQEVDKLRKFIAVNRKNLINI